MNKKAMAHMQRAYDLISSSQQPERQSFGELKHQPENRAFGELKGRPFRTLLIDFKPGTTVVLGKHAKLADIENISEDADFSKVSIHELTSHTFMVQNKYDTPESRENGLIGLVDVYDLNTGWMLRARFEYFDIIKKAPRMSGDGNLPVPEGWNQKVPRMSGDGLPVPEGWNQKVPRMSGDGLPVPEGWEPIP